MVRSPVTSFTSTRGFVSLDSEIEILLPSAVNLHEYVGGLFPVAEQVKVMLAPLKRS